MEIHINYANNIVTSTSTSTSILTDVYDITFKIPINEDQLPAKIFKPKTNNPHQKISLYSKLPFPRKTNNNKLKSDLDEVLERQLNDELYEYMNAH